VWRWVASYAMFEAVVVALALLATVWHAYRRRHPKEAVMPAGFRPTDERFVDPTTGIEQVVWFNAATGERRYRPVGSAHSGGGRRGRRP